MVVTWKLWATLLTLRHVLGARWRWYRVRRTHVALHRVTPDTPYLWTVDTIVDRLARESGWRVVGHAA